MAPRKIQILVGVTLALLVTACQPARNDATSSGRGRLARGTNGGQQFAPRAGTTSAGPGDPGYGKEWGEVTSSAGDQAFWQELYYLDFPALSGLPDDDQLGYVSSQSGQSTGVRFWGNAQPSQGSCAALNAGTALFDRNSLVIHLEIFDDKTGQPRPDGSIRSDIPIQIASGQDDFVDAGGSMQNGQAYLYFTDSYGTIYMSGAVQGGNFSGTMGYSDSATGNQSRVLGNFNVAAGSFFRCN